MHAVIKIASFLVFVLFVVAGNVQALLAGLLLIVPLYAVNLTGPSRVQIKTALKMLKRLRWLFLSIFVVYLFFTPGELLWQGVLWGPTSEGLVQGFSRIAVLILIVAAVNVLLASTEQEAFLSATGWYLRPLMYFGVAHERLAVRITLTLEAVSKVRDIYQHEPHGGEMLNSEGPRLMAIVETAQRLFTQVIHDAENTPLYEMVLPEQSHPPLTQWLIPIGLVALFMMGRFFL